MIVPMRVAAAAYRLNLGMDRVARAKRRPILSQDQGGPRRCITRVTGSANTQWKIGNPLLPAAMPERPDLEIRDEVLGCVADGAFDRGLRTLRFHLTDVSRAVTRRQGCGAVAACLDTH